MDNVQGDTDKSAQPTLVTWATKEAAAAVVVVPGKTGPSVN